MKLGTTKKYLLKKIFWLNMKLTPFSHSYAPNKISSSKREQKKRTNKAPLKGNVMNHLTYFFIFQKDSFW